ncbi:glycosyltransferase family 4 protein [Actinomycetota bacterium]|nr:glycosyltransferase family 4 protein [Actinomycetota bacterium]
MGKKCVYLSDSDGIHDQRWRSALELMGWDVSLAVTDSHTPVIAGPITTTRVKSLANCSNPIIGLSWGWDLHASEIRQSAAWLSRLSGLIVDSGSTMEIAISLGANPDAIAMIPWGIDLNQFIPIPRSEKIDLSILSLRAHEPIYRVDTILGAVSHLQEKGIPCSLTVGNEGTLTDTLKRQVDDLGLHHVEFIGHIPENELPALFGKHGFYVSAAETDGTSVTLLQAMAMEVPVVVSDSPGNVAWLKNNPEPTGRLFVLGDSFNLELTLLEAMNFPEVTKNMAQHGRTVVERDADWNRNIWRLDHLLASHLV